MCTPKTWSKYVETLCVVCEGEGITPEHDHCLRCDGTGFERKNAKCPACDGPALYRYEYEICDETFKEFLIDDYKCDKGDCTV